MRVLTSPGGTVTASWGAGSGGAGSGRGGDLADIGAERVVLGAFVDARQVAEEQDGPAGVLVVAAGVAVPVQQAEDVGDQVQVHPVVGHAPFLL